MEAERGAGGGGSKTAPQSRGAVSGAAEGPRAEAGKVDGESDG